MPELPTGTITFMFTDIEGSTRLVQEHGDRYGTLLEAHHRILREAILGSGGIVPRTEGDSFFAVFRSAPAAVSAAVSAQRALAAHPWPEDLAVRVRMGLHTGEATLGGDEYVGLDVHRAARIAATGHGGQVLVSSATAELVRTGLPQDIDLRDLGQHRLKDLKRPERIHQLAIDGLMSEFPPIRSLETPTNLPAQRTSFVGRRAEIVRVKQLLSGPGLLTLSGVGGSGKTRLALQASRELLNEYRDGVFFVELGPITDADLVPSTISDAVGVRAEGWRPALDTLRDHLREREVLLILDNFEQVIGAARDVVDLVAASPRLRVLVTSREPLHVRGERELPVPPLIVPDDRHPLVPEDLTRYEAVALFVERATAVDPAFSIGETTADEVAELCRRLEGLPLAIELAASRVRLLPPREILVRLDRRLDLLTGGPIDLPARQRTLREAIGWSVDLLGGDERALFGRLSVFAGGWTLDSAQSIADPAREPGADILENLASLVDKNLVRRLPTTLDGVRFGMFESIREFATERLEAAGEGETIRGRHAAHFLEVAEAAEPHLRGLDRRRRLDELELEHDNLRAALRRAVDRGDEQVGLRLVGALWRFWHFHGHLAEGRRWAEEVLAMPASAPRTPDRAKALIALGGLAYWQEDLPAMRRAYEEALAIARDLDDRPAIAEGLYNLSFSDAYEGDLESAVAKLLEAKTMFEGEGQDRGIADCLWLLAIVARIEGDSTKARSLVEDSLRRHRQLGDRFGATDALHVLGRIALAEGDLTTAAATSLEALDHDGSVGNRTGMAIALDELAQVASVRGEHTRAARLGGASQSIKEVAGGHAPPPFIDLPDPREAAVDAIGEAAVDAAWKEGRSMTLEHAVAYAREG